MPFMSPNQQCQSTAGHIEGQLKGCECRITQDLYCICMRDVQKPLSLTNVDRNFQYQKFLLLSTESL